MTITINGNKSTSTFMLFTPEQRTCQETKVKHINIVSSVLSSAQL